MQKEIFSYTQNSSSSVAKNWFRITLGIGGQEKNDFNFYRFITYYYTQKDDSIVDHSIAFLNDNIQIEEKQQFKLAAFHIALFTEQPDIREQFEEHLKKGEPTFIPSWAFV
ncbi:MAG: hypothetical protein KAR21_18705 [Spirochaetales bacterium]|nr:hypothetical protein [Spirochaetales bacterium]